MENDRKFLWIYHPNPQVRALRLKQPNKGIDCHTDLTPSYKDEIKIGILISSYGEISDVSKRIDELSKYEILVYDDHSEKSAMKSVKKNNVDFFSPEKTKWHVYDCKFFDQDAFKYGLDWAKNRKIDVLIKIDPNSNLTEENINDLIKLVKESYGLTFSRSFETDMFMTDVFAVNVNAWTTEYVDNLMKWYNENEIPVISEYWYHEIAKELDCQNFSEKYDEFRKKNFKGYLKSGYVEWKLK